MSKPATTLIAVCGMIAGGCHSASSPESTGSLTENESLSPIVHEVYTSFSEPAQFVVRDPGLWAEVWARTFVGRSEVPERPAFDFSREMVVVAAQGAQPSSGYDISIERVVSRDGEITVHVTTISPDDRCGVLTVITAPVMMVRIPRSDRRVEFIEQARIRPCD